MNFGLSLGRQSHYIVRKSTVSCMAPMSDEPVISSEVTPSEVIRQSLLTIEEEMSEGGIRLHISRAKVRTHVNLR